MCIYKDINGIRYIADVTVEDLVWTMFLLFFTGLVLGWALTLRSWREESANHRCVAEMEIDEWPPDAPDGARAEVRVEVPAHIYEHIQGLQRSFGTVISTNWVYDIEDPTVPEKVR